MKYLVLLEIFSQKFPYLEIRTNRNHRCYETISEEAGGPFHLTVFSSGEAGEVWYSSLGVYSKTGKSHNNKTVWARHDGTRRIFLNQCRSSIQLATEQILNNQFRGVATPAILAGS